MSRTVADHFAEILVAAGRTGWLRGKLLSALRSRRNGRVVPGLMSFSTEAVKRSAAEQVPLDVEDVVDGGADGDETLRRNPVEREHVKRRMAAILAADVAGYSRLMGADEEGTLERLKAHRRELIDPKIAAHHGRIVKTTGDGMLVEFVSVVDALRCAVEVQQSMSERNADVPGDHRIEFRGQAIAHLERSARLSPLDPLGRLRLIGFVFAHFIAGRYDEASAWCDKTLQEQPDYPPALRMKAATCGLLGRLEEGRVWVERLLAVNPDTTVSGVRLYYGVFMKTPGCLEAFLDGLRKAGLPA